MSACGVTNRLVNPLPPLHEASRSAELHSSAASRTEIQHGTHLHHRGQPSRRCSHRSTTAADGLANIVTRTIEIYGTARATVPPTPPIWCTLVAVSAATIRIACVVIHG